MARYIDAERLKRTFASGIRVYDGMCKIDDVLHNIENAPTADVVEVPCRCNECRMFVDNKEAMVTYCKRECKMLSVKPTDFCSYGKRRDTNA